MATIKWTRPDDGYIESEDRRFRIKPCGYGAGIDFYFLCYDNRRMHVESRAEGKRYAQRQVDREA